MKTSSVQDVLPLGLIIFFLFFVSGWIYGEQIKIKTENSVTVVYNPKNPAVLHGVPTGLSIKEDLSLGVQIESEESMLLNPTDVDADEKGNIYVLDRKAAQIKIFGRKGEFIKAVGKKGQGPGEFQSPSNFQVTPQQKIIVCDPGLRRVIIFSLEGQFIRELSAGKMWMFTQAKKDFRGDIIGSHTIMDQEARTELVRFNSNLEPLFTVASVPIARYPVFNPYFPLLYFDLTPEGNVLWGITTEYVFHIVNPEGKTIRKIVKEFDPEKLTQEDREKRAREIWGDQGPSSDVRVEWPKYFPAFHDFIMDDRGRHFVRSYTKEKAAKGVSYDVFDAKGRFFARVSLPERAITIKDGKLYTIEEDEDGFRFVKRYSLEWK